TFTLNALEAGAPTNNGSLVNERGTSPNVEVRYNETTDTWEFTNDGSVYQPLGAPDVGVQELSKLVTLENPPAVVDLTSTSSTSNPGNADYIKVDLTLTAPFSSIPNGVQGTTVLIRQLENPSASPAESMRVFARDSADVDDQEGSMILTPGQGVDVSDNILIGFEYKLVASAASAANLKIFVVGYWEKVTGVGTQDFSFTHTEVVAANTTDTLNLTAFANRGLIHEIIINETGGLVVLKYDVKVYTKDTHLAANLAYQVDDIDPAVGPPNWRDTQPWFYVDDDDTNELHLTINNKDLTNSGTYDITIRMERFD
ncbi:MAG: hypothetical protein ACXAEN_23730, partial [Candidatus Thorarchaeota archaeon]